MKQKHISPEEDSSAKPQANHYLKEAGKVLSVIIACCCVLTFVPAARAAVVPRAEHPRPDQLRDQWSSLNGEWQFEIDKDGDGESRGLCDGRGFSRKIIVPFCPESKLSGLGIPTTEHMKDVWYARSFEVPGVRSDQRIRLHFGAVDYKSWVYVNGQFAGLHVGGSSAFSFDITPLLKAGPNTLVVRVNDDIWSGLQPSGKQSGADQSAGCFYTRTTGIWQSVWLESVGSSFVEDFSLVPDPDCSRVLIDARINGHDQDLTLKAEAFAEGRLVGSDTVSASNQCSLVLDLKEKKLWEPGAPFLYDLKFSLYSGKKKIDEMKSYFGLRKVSIDGRRMLINGKPVFQRLILDQGFYPDGLWTAPSDEALKHDIEMSMACGYNGARLHQKVFEPRFLYWADKLGYLLWGEFNNAGYNRYKDGLPAVLTEWTSLILRDRNHPSIIGWCPFNENWESSGEVQQAIWTVTKALDPTRPALEASGWMHTLPNPEVRDAHDYSSDPTRLLNRWTDFFSARPAGPYPPLRYFNPAIDQADRGVPFMVSEIGGIGWGSEGGWSYGAGPKTLDEFYTRYQGTVDVMLDNPNIFGFCYTQLTDIEQEKNGLFYYDRKPKFDLKKLHAITSRSAACERNESLAPQPVVNTVDARWRVLVGAEPDGKLSTPYRYVTETPAEGWIKAGFDDAAWQTGLAPFGRKDRARSEWTTKDVYLRKTFEFDGGDLKHGSVVIKNNDHVEIYLNGKEILSVATIGDYRLFMITDAMKNTLRKGTNTLAIHSRERGDGQYVDVAVLADY